MSTISYEESVEAVLNELKKENVNNVPRYLCEEQSYGVFFKLNKAPIIIDVDVHADGELELSVSEIYERGLNILLEKQSHLTSKDFTFKYVELYSKKYAPIEKTYEKQSYDVKYRMKSGDIAFTINVDCLNHRLLTDNEISIAANTQLEQYFKIEGECFLEDIITAQLIVKVEEFPFLEEVRPDPEHEDWWSDEAMIAHLEDLGYDLTDDNGEFSSLVLADIAANSEGFNWDSIKGVWYK